MRGICALKKLAAALPAIHTGYEYGVKSGCVPFTVPLETMSTDHKAHKTMLGLAGSAAYISTEFICISECLVRAMVFVGDHPSSSGYRSASDH